MRYTVRKIISEGKAFGAFAADEQGQVVTVLIRDYWFRLPRNRKWKVAASLMSASTADLEPEVVAAHPGIVVSDRVLSIDVDPDKRFPALDTEEAQLYRALMNWLMSNTTP